MNTTSQSEMSAHHMPPIPRQAETSNAVFSWTRFVRLAKAHWAENYRGYMGFMLVLAIVYFLVILLVFAASGDLFRVEGQYGMYYFGLMFSGYVFAARYFKSLQQPGSALVSLMQPASVFEKWLLAALWVVVLFPLAYTVLFELMTWPARSLAEAAYYDMRTLPENASPDWYRQFEAFIPFVASSHLDENTFLHQLGLSVVYKTLVAYALLTSLYFRRVSMIKGLVLLLALFLLSALWGQAAASDTTWHIFGFWEAICQERFLRRGYGAPYVLGVALVWLVVPALLWLGSFWALKERDVA